MVQSEQGKILSFTRSAKTLLSLSDQKYKSGEYERALSYLLQAEELETDGEQKLKILKNVATLYQDMALFELSNQYCYYVCDRGDIKDKIWAYNILAENYVEIGDIIGSTVNIYNSMKNSDAVYGRQTIDQEVISAFSQVGVLPEEIAKTMSTAEIAEHNKRRAEIFFRSRDFKECISSYEKVPRFFFDKIAYYELAMSYFYEGNDGRAIKLCNECMDNFGENTFAYCALSSIYEFREDDDKKGYYYGKAKKYYTGNEEETFRICMCAIDNRDDATVESCCQNILLEDKYNVLIRYTLALSKINLGDYASAVDILNGVVGMAPNKRIFKYYLALAKKLSDGDMESKSLLPLNYDDALPKKVVNSYSETVFKTIENKRLNATDKQNLLEIKEWGIESEDDLIIKKGIGLICEEKKSVANAILQKIFLSNEYSKEMKTVALYLAIAWGIKKKVSLVCDYNCIKYNLGKMPFAKGVGGDVFTFAYALSVVRLASVGEEDANKVLKVLSLSYEKYLVPIMELEITGIELSAIALHLSDYAQSLYPDLKYLFGKKYEQICQRFLTDLKGDLENDKDN